MSDYRTSCTEGEGNILNERCEFCESRLCCRVLNDDQKQIDSLRQSLAQEKAAREKAEAEVAGLRMEISRTDQEYFKAQRKNESLESTCAVTRMALETLHKYLDSNYRGYREHENYKIATEALSSTSGSSLLDRIAKLEGALEDVFALIDEGKLVRDTSKDHQESWAIESIGFVNRLAHIRQALTTIVKE